MPEKKIGYAILVVMAVLLLLTGVYRVYDSLNTLMWGAVFSEQSYQSKIATLRQDWEQQLAVQQPTEEAPPIAQIDEPNGFSEDSEVRVEALKRMTEAMSIIVGELITYLEKPQRRLEIIALGLYSFIVGMLFILGGVLALGRKMLVTHAVRVAVIMDLVALLFHGFQIATVPGSPAWLKIKEALQALMEAGGNWMVWFSVGVFVVIVLLIILWDIFLFWFFSRKYISTVNGH